MRRRVLVIALVAVALVVVGAALPALTRAASPRWAVAASSARVWVVVNAQDLTGWDLGADRYRPTRLDRPHAWPDPDPLAVTAALAASFCFRFRLRIEIGRLSHCRPRWPAERARSAEIAERAEGLCVLGGLCA